MSYQSSKQHIIKNTGCMLRCWEASVPARANRCWEKLTFQCWNHAGEMSTAAAFLSFLPGWCWVMLWQCFKSVMVPLMVIMERSWHSQTALFVEALAGKGQRETDNSSNVPFNTSKCRNYMCSQQTAIPSGSLKHFLEAILIFDFISLYHVSSEGCTSLLRLISVPKRHL